MPIGNTAAINIPGYKKPTTTPPPAPAPVVRAQPSQQPPPAWWTLNTGGYTPGGGSGGGGGDVPPEVKPPSTTTPREPGVTIPSSPSGIGGLDEAGKAAQAAVFGRAKDRAGQIAKSALQGLRSSLAARGILGSGMEVQGTLDAAMQGAGLIADTSREEAVQEAQRGERAREFQTQAALQHRGQDITQRGQDINQLLGIRGQDITQRGQTIGGRASLSGLRSAYGGGGNYGGGGYYGNEWTEPPMTPEEIRAEEYRRWQRGQAY